MIDIESLDDAMPATWEPPTLSTRATPALRSRRLRSLASRLLERSSMLAILGFVVFGISSIVSMVYPQAAPSAILLMIASTVAIVLAMSIAAAVAIVSPARGTSSTS